MTVIPDPHKKVPMMFRAQVAGRCQLQRVVKDQDLDVQKWTDEWIDKVYPELPELGPNVQSRTYTINWRLITNSGVDDSIIRPVIGARGWAFFPGSGMKGLFRRACTKDEAVRYCGKPIKSGDWEPGILRFEGGYPIDTSWTERLVDLIHPQQGRQVESQTAPSSAFAQISLYKPTLRFAISSSILLMPEEWETIWQIWERAITTGIGSRVCAGYGQFVQDDRIPSAKVLYQTHLKGEGQAPKLLDGETGEFRPNIFRAGVRGHALRIFGGLTDDKTAKTLVETLFGGVSGKGVVGLVGMSFQESNLDYSSFQKGSSYEQIIYKVEGNLQWVLTRKLNDSSHENALKKLISKLTQFAMIFGGFGKSWRRSDHRKFYEEYYENDRHKPMIGCHWQWSGTIELRRDVQVRKLKNVREFIDQVRQAAIDWMAIQGVKPSAVVGIANWRESWHPERVQVWGRKAGGRDESEAIHWFHGPYQRAIGPRDVPKTIYESQLTGKMGKIGRMWHRMYPWVRLVKDPANPGELKTIATPQYLELLTIFPDGSLECKEFLKFLNTNPYGFKQLWGDE